MRDERDLIAQQIWYHRVQVFASRDAETAVAEAKHRQEILQLLDQYMLVSAVMPFAQGDLVASIIAAGEKPSRAAIEVDELLPPVDGRRA